MRRCAAVGAVDGGCGNEPWERRSCGEAARSGAHLQISLKCASFGSLSAENKTMQKTRFFRMASSKMCAGQICVACAAGPMFTSLLCDNCTGFFMKRVCGECVTKATGCDILTCALCTQLFCQKGGESQWCAWHEAWHHVTCSTADCCGSDCESETDVFKVAWRDEIAGAESGSCDSDGESDHGPEDIHARLLSPAATIVEASVHERIERSDRAPSLLRTRSLSTLVRTDTGVTSDPA